MKKFTLFTLFVTFTSVLFAQTPVVVPEGLETEIYIFSAKAVEEGTSTEPEDYTYQSRIGFDGNDMYIKGLSANTADMWLKATKNAEGKYVIPANQYMGQLNFGGWLVFDYYLAARDENDKAADVVLDFDAENNKFTTNQVVVLHESPEQWYPYQTFTEVAFTKYAEAAATPVDPTMDRVVLKGKYPYIRCTIPATGTNDEALNKEKLYYTHDMVGEVYDIFIEEAVEELNTWAKVGIQSIYYGGNECHKSNIVWKENGNYTDIAGVRSKNEAVKGNIYNIAGQRVSNATKGIYIVNGKKVVVK